jgi:hypothetical protein
VDIRLVAAEEPDFDLLRFFLESQMVRAAAGADLTNE